jgi:HEAT repeat protein
VDRVVRGYGADAEPALLNVLAHGSDRARASACGLLRAVGTEKSLPVLRQAQNDPDTFVALSSRKAVQDLERRLLGPADPESRQSIAGTAEPGRPIARDDSIPGALAAARDSDAPSRLRALRKLGEGPLERKLQDDVASLLITTLADPDPTIRTAAVAALRVWARPGDDRALAGVLDDEDRFVRANALKALSQTKNPEIIAKIVALAEKPGGPTTPVEQAVRSIGALAQPALLKLLAASSARARQSACRMLQDVGTEECLPALRQAQTDSDRFVAVTARGAVQALERKFGRSPGSSPTTHRKHRSGPAPR